MRETDCLPETLTYAKSPPYDGIKVDNWHRWHAGCASAREQSKSAVLLEGAEKDAALTLLPRNTYSIMENTSIMNKGSQEGCCEEESDALFRETSTAVRRPLH